MIAILAALVAAAFYAAGTASGAAAAANEIAYDCKLDICLLDPANPAAVTNLTDNGETSIDEKPIWSPDGKKVAFISNFGVGGSTRNLFVMEPEAPEQGFNLAVQVTHFTSGVPIEEPVWSPDGTRLAFVYGNPEPNDKVEVANSNGTTATPLVVAEHGVHPTWAPESGKIAYSYEGHVYVEDADGAGFPPPLTGAEGDEPVWSPDGSRIAFGKKVTSASFDLGIVPAGGGTPVTLTSGLQFIYPSWSPSGSQVVYRGSGETTAGRQRGRKRRPSVARDPERRPERARPLVVARRHPDRLPGLLLRLRTEHQRRLHAERRRVRCGHPPGRGRKILHLSFLETEPAPRRHRCSPRRAVPPPRCRRRWRSRRRSGSRNGSS